MTHDFDTCGCGHPLIDHQPEFGCWEHGCDCDEFDDEDNLPDDESMVDLGGGMVVPLRELMEDDTDPCPHANRAFTIGGPEDSDGYVWCPDCRTNLSDVDTGHIGGPR